MLYNICDLIVSMAANGRTARQAEPYAINSSENINIEVETEIEEFLKKYPTFSRDNAEYICTGISFYTQLLNYNGFRVHASAVVAGDRAYLFSADSGTGKSTHTQLWLKLFGNNAYILNDDKPALRLEDGAWYAYGTPWSGKNDISVNKRVPVAGIAMLERSESNEIYRFKGSEAIRQILAQCNRPKAPEYRIKLMELLDKLLTTVPIWKLKCNMDPSAAILSYEAMSGEKYKENEDV